MSDKHAQELITAIEALPLIRKTKPIQRNEIFAKKLKFCCVLCNFKVTGAEIKLKQTKRKTLNELIEYMDTAKGLLNDQIYELSTQMFAVNIYTNMPFKIQFFDYIDEEQESKAWNHKVLVYTYFLKFLGNSEFMPTKAKKYFTHSFLQKMVDMFNINDANEREYLKTSLHRVYAKFLGMRAHIRKIITNKLLEAVFENVKVPGLAEILEVMGSIINGYIRPYKEEHIQFLQHVLVPLHMCTTLNTFHAQLVYCVVQFVENDEDLMGLFVRGFMKLWPKVCMTKESLFLGELEEIIDVMQPREFGKLQHIMFHQLARSIKSNHYQVCERALYFWENEYIVSLMESSQEEIFPIVLPALLHVSNFHWNKMTAALANEVLQKFMRPGNDQFEKIVLKVKRQKWMENKKRQALNKKWDLMEKQALNNPLCRKSVTNSRITLVTNQSCLNDALNRSNNMINSTYRYAV